MGSLLTFRKTGSCPHEVVTADGDSHHERSQRLARCVRCGETVTWEEIDANYEEER